MKPHPEWRAPTVRPRPEQPSIQLDMYHAHQLWHPRDATHHSLLVVVDRTTRLILSTFLVANAKSQELHNAREGEQSC